MHPLFDIMSFRIKAFPNIELCKVTHKESKKRYRCYKDLYRKDDGNGPAPIFPYASPTDKNRQVTRVAGSLVKRLGTPNSEGK